MSAHAGEHLVASWRTPSSRVLAVRNTAQSFCMVRCIVERAAAPSACRRWRGAACRGGRAPSSPALPAACLCVCAGLDQLGDAVGGGAAEHHQVEQRVGAEPVGAVHRRRRPPRRSPSGPARRVSGSPSFSRHDLAVIVGRDAAHVVVARSAAPGSAARVTSTPAKMRAVSAMPGRRSWITFGSRCSRCSRMWSLLRAAAAAFADLDGHRAADDVARGQVLGRTARSAP